jgi:5'-nucleotidase
MFGTRGFLESPPNLVASGINRGPNLGIDMFIPGRWRRAHEGHLHNVPSFAISMDVPHESEGYHFETGEARFARILAENLLTRKMPDGSFLNVNVPNRPWKTDSGSGYFRLGQRIYRDQIIRRVDPQGKDYYWIGGEPPTWVKSEGTDFHALEEGKNIRDSIGGGFHAVSCDPRIGFVESGVGMKDFYNCN